MSRTARRREERDAEVGRSAPRRGLVAAMAAGAMALLWLPAAAAFGQGGPPAAQVRVEPARMMNVDVRRDVIGRVEPASRSRVAAEEAGRVVEVLADFGDRVEKGEVLARLDDTLLRIDLERARSERAAREAAVAERRALLDKTRRDYERVVGLVDRGSATSSEREDAATEVAAAESRVRLSEADVASAAAEIARLEERLADMEVRAPFGGRVVTKLTEVGEWIGEGEVAFEVVRLDVLDVVVDVPERFIGAVQKLATEQEARSERAGSSGEDTASDAGAATFSEEGAAAPPSGAIVVHVEALNETFAAERIIVIAEGDRLARTFPVRLRVRNDGERMKPGMSVSASVPTGMRGEMLTVSKDAVLRSDTGPYVYVDDGGAAGARTGEIVYGFGER